MLAAHQHFSTRRLWLATIALMFAVTTSAQAQFSSNASNFNGTAIAAGNYIWFSAVLNPSGTIADGTTIRFTSAVDVDGIVTVVVPTSSIFFSNAATSYSTTFTANGEWVTTVPTTYSGNIFLAGRGFLVPAPGLSGGANPVTWAGTFQTNSATPVGVQWKWAAAVYSAFSSDNNSLQVKAVDVAYGANGSTFDNSHHAGTPEAFRTSVVGGARGGGGSNFTGSYSGTASVTVSNAIIATPEPATFAMFGLGLVAMGFFIRRKRSA